MCLLVHIPNNERLSYFRLNTVVVGVYIIRNRSVFLTLVLGKHHVAMGSVLGQYS